MTPLPLQRRQLLLASLGAAGLLLAACSDDAANASFAAIDITGNDGFAWAIAGFFALYVVLSLGRLLFNPKRT